QPSKAKTDRATARTLLSVVETSDRAQRLGLVRGLFFTEKGEPKAESSICTRSAASAIKEALLREQDRLVGLDERLKAARAIERTEALFTLAQAIVTRVEAHKARIGAVDFQDLIAKTL